MEAEEFVSKLGETLKSCIKMAMQSRRGSIHATFREKPLVILANGPSLNRTIEENREQLAKADLMAVNFAANAPVFRELKPAYYILADPHFFSGAQVPNLVRLQENLVSVTWRMTLLVPCPMLVRVSPAIIANPNIDIKTFNAVGAEGFERFEHTVYGSGLAMPRPRNVLIPAIMCAMWLGYRKICITGADHSWMQTIYVDDENHVVSEQPHFYKDDDEEKKRVYSEYAGYRLHDIVHSFYVAFRSYHRIASYADAHAVRIVNCTPGSYIDAFPRASLGDEIS